MECNVECPAREAIESSPHPQLEAPCFLVYLYMSYEEKVVDKLRVKAHATEHLIRAIGGYDA